MKTRKILSVVLSVALAVAIFVSAISPVFATSLYISHVHAGQSAADSSTTIQVTITGIQQNDMLVVSANTLVSYFSGVTDSASNTYTHDAKASDNGNCGTAVVTDVWYTFTATSASSITVTGTWAVTNNFRDIVVTDYRGISSFVSGTTASGGRDSNNPTMQVIFTTGNTELVIATVNSAITSSQLTTDFRDSGNLIWDGYEGNPFSGTVVFTWTGLVNDCWSMVGLQIIIPATAQSTTTVSCSSTNFSTNGGTSTCTATVTGSFGTPTGMITWSVTLGPVGSFTPGTCTLSGGSCSTSYSSAIAGVSTVQAGYGGDGTYMSSSGNTTVTASTPIALAAVAFMIIFFVLIFIWFIRKAGKGKYKGRWV